MLNYNEEICDHCIDKFLYADYKNRLKQRLQKWKLSSKKQDEWVINDITELFSLN